jgi:2-dehydro-3-deoxyphosphogluconate aldolase / (4S)-4-hydroxy-2-oxoglutarate aldolase
MIRQTESTATPRPAELGAKQAEVVDRLSAGRVIPVCTIDDVAQVRQVCHALAKGGVHCIEITFRAPAAAEAIRRAREVDGMLVGAGTVLSPSPWPRA